MSDIREFQRVVERTHNNLYANGAYTAEFYNISQGTRDNINDTYSGETRSSIGTLQVEIVPPAIDSTVNSEGTTFSWDTSIRFPIASQSLTVSNSYTVESGTVDEFAGVTIESGATLTVDGTLVVFGTITNNGTLDNNGTVRTTGDDDFPDALIPLGDDNRKPTEVELSDPVDNDTDVFELHGYSFELGSNMAMCRLVEQ